MRILYVVSLFPCWSETFIVREIREMLARGADVRILSLRHPSESLVQSDAAALLGRVFYPAPWWRALAAIPGALLRNPVREAGDLARLVLGLWRHPSILAKSLVVWWRTHGALAEVRGFAPAHIHAHFATYASTSAWLLARRLGIPYSITAHAHDIFLEDHLLSQKLGSAAFVAVISEFNRNWLLERVAGAHRARIRVVHCGVASATIAFTAEGREARRILAVGRLDEIKGFEHLIEACGILASRGIDFECDIIGSGPLEAALASRIAGLGLEPRVRLLGARKQEEVQSRLATATVFVLPSVVTSRGDRDGIPVALMEAMACGLPVVSTRVSGIPELVEDGVTGLLSPPGDAPALAACVERLLGDRDLARNLAARARKKVESDFDICKESRKLHDAIASRD